MRRKPIRGDVGPSIAKIENIHVSDVVSMSPMVVGQRTLDHAAALARQIVAQIERMPLSQQAGDTIAMAVALLHYVHAASQ